MLGPTYVRVVSEGGFKCLVHTYLHFALVASDENLPTAPYRNMAGISSPEL